MRGKISRGKQPRFAPVFRLFSAPAPSARKKYAALRFSLRLPLRRPASAFAAQALPAKKRSRRPSFPYYIYCLPIRTAQDFSTRRAIITGLPKIAAERDFWEPCLFSGHTLDKTRGGFTSIQTKSKQKGPALKGVFCAPCGSSSLQYLCGYCCFVCRPNSSQNALFQGA